MPARLLILPSVRLDGEQQTALELAARTLPDDWSVIVASDGLDPDRFTVRVVGLSFVEVMGGSSRTARPDQLSAFLDRLLREHSP